MPTKSQKISGAILGLAAVAFAVDRWVLGPPEGAAAATSGASEYAVSRPAAAPAGAGSAGTASASNKGGTLFSNSATAGMTLASRLGSIGEQRQLAGGVAGDAFRPADAWLAALLSPSKSTEIAGDVGTEPVVPMVDGAIAFAQRHTLTAVMKKRTGSMAIVDGKLYAAGQAIDGFTLKRVGLNEAVFSGNGITAVLRMGPNNGAPTGAAPVADAR